MPPTAFRKPLSIGTSRPPAFFHITGCCKARVTISQSSNYYKLLSIWSMRGENSLSTRRKLCLAIKAILHGVILGPKKSTFKLCRPRQIVRARVTKRNQLIKLPYVTQAYIVATAMRKFGLPRLARPHCVCNLDDGSCKSLLPSYGKYWSLR